MDAQMQQYMKDLESTDREKQYEAFLHIMTRIEDEVDWAYEVWDQFVEELTDLDNHKRARAAQLLAGLAISDPDGRMLQTFPALSEVTKDERFVTARHSLQSIWKVGLAGEEQKNLVLSFFVDRFHQCTKEKHPTLIRFDIIQGLRKLYDVLGEAEIKETALELIAMEDDEKYKKKYASVWKGS